MTDKDYEVLASYASESNPNRIYEVRRSIVKPGQVWCTCPAWRFQKRPARERTCKHILAYRHPDQSFDIDGVPNLETAAC